MPSITIDSVSSASSVRNAIAATTGHDTATVHFTPTTSDASPIIGYDVRVGGTSPDTGVSVGKRGLFLSESLYLSEDLYLDDFQVASGTQISEDLTYTEMQDTGEGVHTVNVWAASATEGWNG